MITFTKVGRDSTTAGAGKVVRATLTFDMDPQLLSIGGFTPLGGGEFQQPYFPFGSSMLTAPDGFSFPDGFPFADGGAGHDPLRRLAGRAMLIKS